MNQLHVTKSQNIDCGMVEWNNGVESWNEEGDAGTVTKIPKWNRRTMGEFHLSIIITFFLSHTASLSHGMVDLRRKELRNRLG